MEEFIQGSLKKYCTHTHIHMLKVLSIQDGAGKYKQWGHRSSPFSDI